jgi:hypothetical protein
MAETQKDYSPDAVHLLRTTQLIHVQLSAMADAKANILMGATFVTFTLALGQLRSAEYFLPLMILGVAAFLSAVLSILAVMPTTRAGSSRPDNLLFFGSFSRMDEEAFVDRLLEVLHSKDETYRSMAIDLHQNGCVLARKKFRLLGYAYRVFLGGLVGSFLALVAELL